MRLGFLHPNFWLHRIRARRAVRPILRMVDAFDLSIALAELRDRPIGALVAAKGDFLRQAVR